MLLCLDVGNTHIYGGLFNGETLAHQFRYPSKNVLTSDELGIFLKNYLREIEIAPSTIQRVSYCSVVPSLDYSIRSAFIKYFGIDPFVLQAGIRTGLMIKYKIPTEVGADRIANAMAGCALFPQKNIIIVDCGTATTVEVISHKGAFLGGTIIPGLQMQMRSLHEYTANLPPVRIVQTPSTLGQSTTSNIQSGLYIGHRGAIKEMLQRIKEEQFDQESCAVIGTGGFAQLYEKDKLFDALVPDLVLLGLKIAYEKNIE